MSLQLGRVNARFQSSFNVFLLCAASLLAGCGGGGGGSAAAPTSVAPTITAQPANVSVAAGQTATFTVVASGTAPLSYQWQQNGTSISGATGASYTTAALTVGNSGSSYTVVVSNASGSVTSSAATLTVTAVATAPTITTQPSSTSVSVGATATFTVVASGTAPLSYQWQLNGTNISGATAASYTTAALTLGNSGSIYTVVVSNAAGSVTSSAATLTVTAGASAPTITTQPGNATVNDGATATFTVVASGSGTLTYQWQKGGTNISGATGASYTTPALTLANNGSSYTVVVSNTAGNIASNAATLTVKAVTPTITTQPANIAAAFGATTATFTVVVNAGSSTPTYQWYIGNPPSGTSIAGATTATYNYKGSDGTSLSLDDVNTPYYVIVTNTGQGGGGGGAVTSNVATLEVTHTLALLAGGLGGVGDNNATGTAATFYGPAAVAVDSSGNVYVADETNQLIRKITSAGVVSNFAGTAAVAGSTDGTGAGASFNGPSGVAVDTAGNVYVADSNNDTIRKITPAGVVTTLAGSAGVTGSANGTGAAASFNGPNGVAVDTAGNVYVADSNNDTIRKIAPGAVVTTLAGSPGVAGSTNGTGAAARFNLPKAVAVDSTGNVYVADSLNSTIRKVTSVGVVTTLAGSPGTFGSANGTGAAAQFNGPTGVALDSAGANLYVADAVNQTVRQVTTSAGVVTTLAGTTGTGGAQDGTGTAATFEDPSGVATDASGNVYVADSDNNEIRKITTPGAVVSTLAGNIGGRGYYDAAWVLAKFDDPHNIVRDAAGNVFVADLGNNVIRKIAATAQGGPGSTVTTYAGSVGPGGVGSNDGTGANAQFNGPFGMAIDSNGNLYVSDSKNNTIRKITPAGTPIGTVGAVTTFVGTAGVNGCVNGTGAAAQFWTPYGLAFDAANNLYVADNTNEIIRMVTPGGVVSTVAGTCSIIGYGDGTGFGAIFNGPHGLAVNQSTGIVYVADRFNNAIRRIAPGGVVTTVAGNPSYSDLVDGTGTAAHFDWPGSLTVDQASGTLYVTDYLHNAVREITTPDLPGGEVVTTVVGNLPGAQPSDGAVLGPLSGALSGPTSITAIPDSPALQLIIADDTENAILLATLP